MQPSESHEAEVAQGTGLENVIGLGPLAEEIHPPARNGST